MPASLTIWERANPVQSAQSTSNDLQHTFSSWDACMSKSYCKWPVIVAIIIAAAVVFSLVFCLFRCLCCGLECCCGCLSCCNACCPSPRGRRRGGATKYQDPPERYHQAPLQDDGGGGAGAGGYGGYRGYQATPVAPAYNPQPQPQYAQFETSNARKPVSEDSLPAMPSWSDAATKKVPMPYDDKGTEMHSLDPVPERPAPMPASTPYRDTAPGISPYAQDPSNHHHHRGYADAGAYANPARQHQSSSPFTAISPPPNRYASPAPSYHTAPSPPLQSYGPPSSSSSSFPSAAPVYQQQPTGLPPGLVAGLGPRQTAYPAYAPSPASTRYESSTYHAGQESGVLYGSPLSPSPPSQRRPPVEGGWRDV